ncbi:hypothetical protein Ddye_014065 [Dipteronia dyeriana]|uniref:Uncharacterized protein n=1 Tax=Dipteronia dyeriana TaxID=168575 RepID=A0AAD9X7I6_9ROSI|nr:hypothetical protein Ddye_014065 [Dipteronia dyeriana]
MRRDSGVNRIRKELEVDGSTIFKSGGMGEGGKTWGSLGRGMVEVEPNHKEAQESDYSSLKKDILLSIEISGSDQGIGDGSIVKFSEVLVDEHLGYASKNMECNSVNAEQLPKTFIEGKSGDSKILSMEGLKESDGSLTEVVRIWE